MSTRRLLKILVGLGVVIVIALLFSESLPIKVNRSWLLVPSLLFTVMAALGATKFKKRWLYFKNVVAENDLRTGRLEIVDGEAWSTKKECIAFLSVDRQKWELHFFTPKEVNMDLLGSERDCTVYFDDQKRPAIVASQADCWFVSSARLSR